jgi:hypothetical protein
MPQLLLKKSLLVGLLFEEKEITVMTPFSASSMPLSGVWTFWLTYGVHE